MSKLINPDVKLSKDEQSPKCTFEVQPNMQINSLLSTDSFLIVGAVGEIRAYSWKAIKTSKNVLCAWSIDIPNDKGGLDRPDVNSLYFQKEKDLIFVGCGDNNIYVFHIETRKLIKTLSAHIDYVHCLCGL